MRFVLLLFLALISTTVLTSPEALHGAARQQFKVSTISKLGSTKYFATKPWQGLFSAKKFGRTDNAELKDIRQALQASLVDLPSRHTAALKTLEVRKQQHASRGLANSKMVILNTESISSKNELQAVFTHEMGHVVDLGYLTTASRQKTPFWTKGTQVFVGDPSIDFYRLSWIDYKTRKKGIKRSDFVSGYAMSSPFEDFAECYIFYRLHGEKFRQIAANSTVLKAKYNFMKTQVFNGEEFQLQKKSLGTFVHNVIWDATLVKF